MSDLPKKINLLLQQASLLPLENATMLSKIEDLSVEVREFLIQAIKDKKLYKVLDILGIEFGKDISNEE